MVGDEGKVESEGLAFHVGEVVGRKEAVVDDHCQSHVISPRNSRSEPVTQLLPVRLQSHQSLAEGD
eukprot:757096-Hanusia_phi.AAC.2